ncbi:uncharacterized protein LOC114914966 [Cajanus cajan]|uniref:uncharacterized protein LOC114914966 n=1 Tax=Cajanus cajan TaxID=3821 RepID=UPI0010FB9C8B|nr:uncharacterized protein LOC114914966 [Cajanus cajan]
MANSPTIATSSEDVGSVPFTPHMHISTTSSPPRDMFATPSSTTQPPTILSSSMHQMPPLPPVPGFRDSSYGKIWVSPGAKHDFLPPKGPSRVISNIIKAKYDSPWPNWTKVPQDYKNMWFDEFKKKYKWFPRYEKFVRATFNHKGSVIVKNTMSKLQAGKDKGEWIIPEVRQQLDAYWSGDDFKKKSDTSKQNRAIDNGASLYTGESISITVHRKRMVHELNRDSTIFDLMARTKKNKDGQWVNDKAKDIVDEFIRHRENIHPVDDTQDVFGE